MLIEWNLTREGECKRLEDVPRGASVVAIDGEAVLDRCEVCGVPILESAPHHAWADGIVTCLACGGPEETRNYQFEVGGVVNPDGSLDVHEVSIVPKPPAPDPLAAAIERGRLAVNALDACGCLDGEGIPVHSCSHYAEASEALDALLTALVSDPSTAAYKAALLALTRPQIKGDRCRWCRNRRTRVHSSGCPTTIATAALRGIAPRERTPG